MAELYTQEVEFDDVKFHYEGRKYSATGTATHQVHLESVGIGAYEYWGARCMDHREAWLSEISDMEIDISIYDENGNEVENPPDKMVDSAHLAIFEKTYETAEERCE